MTRIIPDPDLHADLEAAGRMVAVALAAGAIFGAVVTSFIWVLLS